MGKVTVRERVVEMSSSVVPSVPLVAVAVMVAVPVPMAVSAPVDGSIVATSVSVEVGSATQLSATVSPTTASDPSVSWSSGNEGIATVSSTGVVTGVSPGTATITATADNKTATCTVTVTAPVVPPGNPNIIYIENPGPNAILRLGKWGDKITNINIARFKFGSLVGTYNPTGDTGDTFDPGDIGFNPIPATSNVSITGTAGTAWGLIPFYQSLHGSGNASASSPYKEVTPESGYINDTNLRFGKGDPCRLIGLSAAEAQTRAANNTLDTYVSGYRLPTVRENMAFAGMPDAATVTPIPTDKSYANTTYPYWTTNSTTGVQSPNTSPRWNGGTFPVKTWNTNSGLNTEGAFLPAAGYRNSSSGAVGLTSSYGYYWSSTPNNSTYGYYLYFYSSYVHPAYTSRYAFGFPVRCVSAQ